MTEAAGKKLKPAALQLDAHHRYLAAGALAIMALFGLHGHAFPTQLVGAWDVFALTTVVLAWLVLSTKDPYEVRRNASLQDSSRTLLFIVVVTGAAASLCAACLLLASSKNPSQDSLIAHLTLAIAAIVLSWTLVHTLFSLHYAHIFYTNAHKTHRKNVEGGLIFPGDGEPDYLDFAYFSFVIGMTCQVSDVQISSKRMRRHATAHGLISFAFNTALLAMFVNIIAGLI
jgi:uncharacterized membrane protein